MNEKKNEMKYLVLIQARCGSSRLPNKVLMDIAGKPDFQWVVERVQRSALIDEIMIVTSIERENLPLIRLCSERKIRVFVGSENDVLDRFYQAARLLKPEYIIRITADCPLFDWRYLDQAISMMETDTDYLWMGENGFPDGLDLEIISFDALKKSWLNARMASEREHVTLYVKNHPEMFSIQVFEIPMKGQGHYRWTLDEGRDYEMISKIYEYFLGMGKEDFVTEDIVAYLKEHPEVEVINADICRNEGLNRSVKNDRILSNRDEAGDLLNV